MPLPFPIEDNIGGIVEDGLALADLAEEAAFCRVVDNNPIDGGVTRLVLMEEPRVLGEGALLPLVLLNVRLSFPDSPSYRALTSIPPHLRHVAM